MKKYISYIAISLILVLCVCSCNLDSSEGIIQAAATAVEVVPYKISNVLGRFDSNSLIVATDKGICKINPNGSFDKLFNGGNLANATVYATSSSFRFFNEDSLNYPTVDYNGSTIYDSYPSWEGYTIKGIHSQDGISFTYTLEKDGVYYRNMYVEGKSLSPTPVAEEHQISIIGDNAYVTITANGTYPNIIVNNVKYNLGDGIGRICGAIEVNGTVYAIDINGKAYYFEDASSTGTYIENTNLSKTIASNYVPMKASSDGTILYIYPGESTYHIINTTTKDVDTYTDSSLASTIPHLILGKNANGEYLILNEESGAYILSPGNSFIAVKSSNPFNLSEFN